MQNEEIVTTTKTTTDLNVNISINSNEEEKEVAESDAHLPRVRIELDRLNYANESINNLELELEEAKREFLRTIADSDDELKQLERKFGEHIKKSKPYYLARIELNDAKQVYLNTKIRFETAQELYVAAKNMQMYAEENLENYDLEVGEMVVDREHLAKMLEMAKGKVNETELAKQVNDIEQIEAYKIYDEKLKQSDSIEKSLKRSIEKSRKFFELKAKFNKELKFLHSKIEGLKSCLKEAKFAYQQSLKNLETISYEVHAQRKTMLNMTLSEVSIQSSISSEAKETLGNGDKKTLTESSVNTASNEDEEENNENESLEEDFDKYFTESSLKEVQMNSADRFRRIGKTIQYSQKLAKHGVALLSDEEIDSLRMDELLRAYEFELTQKKRHSLDEESSLAMFVNTSQQIKNNKNIQNETTTTTTTPNNTPNRPQFRVPALISQSTLKK